MWYKRGGDRRSDNFNASNGAMKTKRQLAAIAEVGTTTIDRAKQVSRAGLAEKVISGEKTANQVINQEIAKNTPKQGTAPTNDAHPEGVYPTIVIDLSTETLEALDEIQPPLVDDAFLFIWAREKNLPDPRKLLQAWELTYFFIMDPHKEEGGKDQNSKQFNDAFILIGAKGNFSLSTVNKLETAFRAEYDKNTMNIEIFYDTIRRLTNPPRLLMCSHKEIDGFDTWQTTVPQREHEDKFFTSAM